MRIAVTSSIPHYWTLQTKSTPRLFYSRLPIRTRPFGLLTWLKVGIHGRVLRFGETSLPTQTSIRSRLSKMRTDAVFLAVVMVVA